MIKAQIAIDFGGGYLRIFEKKLGLVYNEPSLIAVEKHGKKYAIIAIGNEAEQFEGTKNQLVFSPIAEGAVQSVEFASALLKRALESVFFAKTIKNTKVFISVPSGLDKTEKTKFLKTCSLTGITDAQIVDGTLCAAIGLNKQNEEILIIDLGASKSDFQILQNHQIQKNATLGLGANSIQNAIMQTLWDDLDLYVTPQTAKNIQMELGSLFSSDNNSLQISAIHTQTKEHITKNIMAQKIYPIIKGFFDEVALCANTLLEEYLPNTVQCIAICGGLAKTPGIEKFFLKNFPNTNIFISENPEETVLEGLKKIIS